MSPYGKAHRRHQFALWASGRGMKVGNDEFGYYDDDAEGNAAWRGWCAAIDSTAEPEARPTGGVRWRTRAPVPRCEWHLWFAWHPVTNGAGDWVWLTWVRRRWNSETNFKILAPWDPGDYCGAWEYQL